MRHEIYRMISKYTDYRICNKCDHWNWYENEVCSECGSEELYDAEASDAASLEHDFEGQLDLELEV